MAVRHVRDLPEEPAGAGEGASRRVLIGSDEGPNFAMRTFTIRAGGHMPLHANTVEYEQCVLAGRAEAWIGEDFLRRAEAMQLPIPPLAPPPGSPSNAASAGLYLLGLVASRLAWIAARAPTAWYVADDDNLATIALHARFGFEPYATDFWFPGLAHPETPMTLYRSSVSG